MSETATPRPRYVRAIIAELPRLQADIVRRTLQQRGVDVAAEVRDPVALDLALETTGSDLVIVPAVRAQLAVEYHHLLRRHPGVRLMTLSVGDDGADVIEVRLVGSDVGAADLAEAIQRASELDT